MATKEIKVENNVAVLGWPACGAIDPDERVKRGEILSERIDDMCCSLDSHYVWVGDKLLTQAEVDTSFYKMMIPKWCVDGRLDDGTFSIAPNAAGGTYSLVVGEALVDADKLIARKMTSATHGEELFSELSKNGYDIGVHCADHAEGQDCGCGACDKMSDIFRFMVDNMACLSEKAAELGVDITASLQAQLSENANNLLASDYIASGKDMNRVAEQVTDASHNQKLVGNHNEVLLVINTVVGTTLDRTSLAEKFGEEYEAFNLDVWALRNGIDAIATSPRDADDKFAASVLYNLATAYVLAGPSLRVVVR